MSDTTQQELEEAIKFGKRIGRIDSFLGLDTLMFDSDIFSDNFKRKMVSRLDSYRQFVQEIVETADQKYHGIKVAEEAKAYALEMLLKFEEAARPYLD